MSKKKKIYVVCSCRLMTDDIKDIQENVVSLLEEKGHEVYYPARDTDQKSTDIEINKRHRKVIKKCDEVHVVWNPKSMGSHFDIGLAYAFKKKIVLWSSIKTDDEYASAYGEWIMKISK